MCTSTCSLLVPVYNVGETLTEQQETAYTILLNYLQQQHCRIGQSRTTRTTTIVVLHACAHCSTPTESRTFEDASLPQTHGTPYLWRCLSPSDCPSTVAWRATWGGRGVYVTSARRRRRQRAPVTPGHLSVCVSSSSTRKAHTHYAT